MPSIREHQYAVVACALTSDPRQAPTLARQAGFAGVLFDAYSASLNFPELSASGRREFRHVMSSQDRQLVGLRVDLGAKGFGPGADVDQVLSQLDKVLETAKALAAPLVCVELGPLPQPPKVDKPKPRVTPDEAGLILIPTFVAAPAPEVTQIPEIPAQVDPIFVAQVDGALGELGVLADRYNVMVALRSDLASFAALDRALTTARCPWFGVDLDPVAILRDQWNSDEIFSRFGPLIRHVRGRDAVCGMDRRTKPAPIGRGDSNWDQMLSNLEGAEFHEWITIDPIDLVDRNTAALAGLKYLQMHI